MPSDPFQMAVIHRAFRSEFANLPGLIRGVAPGDAKRSTLVAKYLGNMISVLHHHHAAEDEELWPKLHARIPDRNNEIQRAEDEHVGIAALIERAQSVQPSWADSADPQLAERLATSIEELSSRIDQHLDDEEQNIVALIGEYITCEEWQAFIDRGAAYLTPHNLWFALAFVGFLLRDATPEERTRFVAAVPFAPRVLVKLLGRRAYTAYRTKLYGAPMSVHSFDDANAFHRTMRTFAATKAGRVFFRPTAHHVDQLVSTLTAGKHSFAGIVAGMPSVILTTTGAKSGKRRTVVLLAIPHPDGLAVVAANYGGAKHPGWYHNLKNNPAATVTIEGDTWPAIARSPTPIERDEIWAKGVDIYPGLTKEDMWAGDRLIEAFVLTRNERG